jgi:hypothetical protein
MRNLEEHVERVQRNRFAGVSAVSTRLIINPFTKSNCGTTQRTKTISNTRGFLNFKMQLPSAEKQEQEGEEGLSCTTSRMHRSQWPRGLRHEMSSLARTLGPYVRIQLEAWMSVCVYSVFVLGISLAMG